MAFANTFNFAWPKGASLCRREASFARANDPGQGAIWCHGVGCGCCPGPLGSGVQYPVNLICSLLKAAWRIVYPDILA